MDTPICDFISHYGSLEALRLHMPGHKGLNRLGFEERDITEIPGADSLFEASGIIAKSEKNAGAIFGCNSFYSTEGSSLCIRAMMYLCTLYAKSQGRSPIVAAFRNVHKSFLSAAALWDLDIQWIYPENGSNYLSCGVTPDELAHFLRTAPTPPVAVYVTCPDYLGNMLDLHRLSQICHQHQALLVVDNAHGAYLKFLDPSMHPMDLGADMCCDSAHKTLPALTGGAYLHISSNAPKLFTSHAKLAMSMVASTSPSYLILQSLDLLNPYLRDQYPMFLSEFIIEADKSKAKLIQAGFSFIGDEPLKWTIDCKSYGYRGDELSRYLYKHGLVCEFCDPDYLVMMLTPDIGSDGLNRITETLCALEPLSPIQEIPPEVMRCQCILSPREASMSLSEVIPIEECEGRILADPSVGCPPAVPILVSGEQINSASIAAFRYYGLTHCRVCI